MPRISLKNLLASKSDLYPLIQEFIGDVYIEDLSQQLLFGKSDLETLHSIPVHNEEEVIGWVKGNEKTLFVSSLINRWVAKELEKKKLGHEILMLYQDVNLMFDFSEKLAKSIGQSSIAEITLDEASRLIKFSQGIMVLWNESKKKVDVTESPGQHLFNDVSQWKETDPVLQIIRNDQSDIVGDLAPFRDAGLIVPEVQALMYAALKVKHRVMGAIIFGSAQPIQYSASDLKFLVTIALQSAASIESAVLYEQNIREAREREEAMRKVYEVANKFVPHEFIKSLGRKVITDIQLGDQVEKIVTVLFSDIRGYTTIAETLTPEENFQFVCSFNERIGPIIRHHKGFINQYLGDAIMAIFPGNPDEALSAAIDMQKAVTEMNELRIEANKSPIKIGVGMYTGPLIMGITGDHERLDATTIADTVNTASRLESLTKHYHVGILLGEASVQQLDRSKFHIRHLGSVQLKGKKRPVSIFECFDGTDEESVQRKLSSLTTFEKGMSAYYLQQFSEASSKFEEVLQTDPDDHTSRLFQDKANQYSMNGIPQNWTGVEEMQFK